MIIMQTLDASARRKHIEDNKLCPVIFSHELEDSVCIQYHPKGIKGGMMPELDSHHLSAGHPEPLKERFSPWHAAGPPSEYPRYAGGMKRHSALHILSAVLKLAPGDANTCGAAKQWEDIFGVERSDERDNELNFTNATMIFVAGEEGKSEGLVEMVIGVEGKDRIDGILARGRSEGLGVDNEGIVKMLGVRWKFVPLERGGDVGKQSRSRL